MLHRRKIKLRAALPLLLACLAAEPVHANCTNPAGKEAGMFYNADYHTWQFCNGTTWVQYRSGNAWKVQSDNNPTYPMGSGFFVLSHGTYNGNLGGRSGADATCLTDLTTNTGWKGYSTAHANGQLIGAKVHAFLCDQSTCTNLNASTTYYFASAQNSGAGGASFTTDSSGNGPNDSADWAAANYFSGTYNYWTGQRTGASNTVWTSVPINNQYCAGTWIDGTSGNNGLYSASSNADMTRFNGIELNTCNLTLNLICFVNP